MLNQIPSDPIIEPKGYSEEKIAKWEIINKLYQLIKNRSELIENQTIVYVLWEFCWPARTEE